MVTTRSGGATPTKTPAKTPSKASKATAKTTMIGLVPGSMYVKAYAFILATYALMMLFAPGGMVTDHFDMTSTKEMEFWIRGASVGFGCTAFLVTQVPTKTGVMVATLASIATGILYPYNAKFGLFTPGLKLKYPMHYVPEVLMGVLSLTGILAM